MHQRRMISPNAAAARSKGEQFYPYSGPHRSLPQPLTPIEPAPGSCDLNCRSSDLYSFEGHSHSVSSKPDRSSPELRRLSSELRRLSPELRRLSSELRRLSSELRRLSSELRRLSSELRRLSSELRRLSSELRRSSSEFIDSAWLISAEFPKAGRGQAKRL